MAKETTYTGTELGILAVGAPVFIAILLVATLPFTFWSAYVAMKLWNWFPAVYFHLQPISFWMTLGISFAVSMFKTKSHYKDHNVDWKSELAGWILGPPMMLFLGYLIHLKIS